VVLTMTVVVASSDTGAISTEPTMEPLAGHRWF
jgi:hypothetical protein